MIRYEKRRKYKYTLHNTCCYHTYIRIKRLVSTKYITLDTNGFLVINAGYSWDGPSGPAIDTKNFMRASLIHDALYQLMREGLLDINRRKEADKVMYTICNEDGMSKIRAWWAYQGVRVGGASSAKSNIFTAP